MSIIASPRWVELKDRMTNSTREASARNITVDANRGIGVGYVIYAATWNSIVSTAQNAARYCSCHCNYCTCDCNYGTYNCNHACTCDCNY